MVPGRDLPEDRLGTTAADGSRVYLYPAEVRGRFRSLRNVVYDVLLAVFLALPWIRVGGKPLLLLDIPSRHFHIFGLTFWGHDAPMIFLVIVGFVVTIGLATAVFGRGWCGWACPQTVFIDRVYARIERWVEGDSVARQRLAAEPMGPRKALKRAVKWALFAGVSLVITHSFLAYFVGTDRLASMITRPPSENWASFMVIAVTTGVILFDFGWFREQFCVIACPYGRFQSVLMDPHSRIVAYDEKRGEPRLDKGMDRKDAGDCVNCRRCVQVCPTGIDIRRGVQMECVACTACIDACDEVMVKVGKPKGLIRYDTEAGLAGQRPQHLRPRTVIYSTAILAAAAALILIVSGRELVKVSLVRAGENPYQIVEEGRFVINHYKINVRNQNAHDVQVLLELPPALTDQNLSAVTPQSPLPVPAGQSVRADLFVTFPRGFAGPAGVPVDLQVRVQSKSGAAADAVLSERLPLVGPENS